MGRRHVVKVGRWHVVRVGGCYVVRVGGCYVVRVWGMTLQMSNLDCSLLVSCEVLLRISRS